MCIVHMSIEFNQIIKSWSVSLMVGKIFCSGYVFKVIGAKEQLFESLNTLAIVVVS